jgi:hypothetical protein
MGRREYSHIFYFLKKKKTLVVGGVNPPPPLAMTNNFGHNIEKRQIGHRQSHVAPTYKRGNRPTEDPPYMGETVEND